MPFGLAPLGTTGTSMIDVWTFVHLAFWFVIGANILSLRGRLALLDVLACVALALVWEIVEKWVLEPRGFVKHPESALNRWVSDVFFACPVGVLLGASLVARQ